MEYEKRLELLSVRMNIDKYELDSVIMALGAFRGDFFDVLEYMENQMIDPMNKRKL